MAAVAGTVAALIVAVAFIPVFDQHDSADEPLASARGGFDDTLTCPHTLRFRAQPLSVRAGWGPRVMLEASPAWFPRGVGLACGCLQWLGY